MLPWKDSITPRIALHMWSGRGKFHDIIYQQTVVQSYTRIGCHTTITSTQSALRSICKKRHAIPARLLGYDNDLCCFDLSSVMCIHYSPRRTSSV